MTEQLNNNNYNFKKTLYVRYFVKRKSINFLSFKKQIAAPFLQE